MPAIQSNSAVIMAEPRPRVVSLETALSLTQAMLVHARGEEWDQLPRLERERYAFIEAGFAGVESVSVPEAEILMDLTGRLLRLNDELTRICGQGKEAHSTALKRISRGRRAQRAYSEAT